VALDDPIFNRENDFRLSIEGDFGYGADRRRAATWAYAMGQRPLPGKSD
jgi:hypothetical protein